MPPPTPDNLAGALSSLSGGGDASDPVAREFDHSELRHQGRPHVLFLPRSSSPARGRSLLLEAMARRRYKEQPRDVVQVDGLLCLTVSVTLAHGDGNDQGSPSSSPHHDVCEEMYHRIYQCV